MGPRPVLHNAEYWITLPAWIAPIECIAYGFDGHFITTIAPGTSLGPVENFRQTSEFSTICVKGWWINVWASAGGRVYYAARYPREDVTAWFQCGWRDDQSCNARLRSQYMMNCANERIAVADTTATCNVSVSSDSVQDVESDSVQEPESEAEPVLGACGS